MNTVDSAWLIIVGIVLLAFWPMIWANIADVYKRAVAYTRSNDEPIARCRLAVATLLKDLEAEEQQAVNLLLLAQDKGWDHALSKLEDYPDVAKAVRREVAKRAAQA